MSVPVLGVECPTTMELWCMPLHKFEKQGGWEVEVHPWQKTRLECLKARRLQQAEEMEEEAQQVLPPVVPILKEGQLF